MNNIKRSFKKLHLKKNLIKFSSFVFSLFLIFSSINFSFASVSDYPSYGGNFSQVVNQQYFMKCGDNLSTDSSNPSYLFNNVYAYTNSSGRTVVEYYYNGSFTTAFTSTSNQQDYVYFYYLSGQDRVFLYPYWSNSIPSFGSSNSSTSSWYINRSFLSPSFSIGSSVEWASLVPPTLSSVSLQNGYLAVIDLGQSGSSFAFTFSSFSDRLSNFISGKFTYANQKYWFTDVLPSSNTTVPASGASLVDWEPVEPKTVLGQSHYMQATISGTSSGRYLCLYNPPVHLVSSGSGNSQIQVVNEPVAFAVPQGLTVYIMDSSGSLSLVSGGGLVGTLTGDVGVGTASASGGAIVFTDTHTSDVFVQNPGGSTDTTSISNQSVNSFLSQIQETLNNFVDSFLSLLSAPISHIQQLISAGSEFFTVFSGLFSWLPSDLVSVVVASLTIMVVIGVFKMLL